MQRPSILLIEDDLVLGSLYLALIEGDGYRARWAQSAEEMYAAVERELPDLILLDVMLPDKSGIELLTELGVLSTRTVMLTNLDQHRVQETVRKRGALGYLIKSELDPDAFVMEVRGYVQQAARGD
jgi:DNA-binding response OmpR family regulator